MEKTITLFTSIIDSINSFDDFENIIKNMDNKTKGDMFELFAELYCILIPEYQKKKYFMYCEIPENLKQLLKLPERDKGIDGLLIDDEEVYAVQVKFRSDPTTVIPFGEMATFMALTHGSGVERIKHGIFFTNCYDVCEELMNNKYMIINRTSLEDKCDTNFWEAAKKIFKNQPVAAIRIPKIPHQYQQDILGLCKQYFLENHYGRLYMPCGTGKSLMGLWIAIHTMGCNKIFIAVPSLYLLSATFETWVENCSNTDNMRFLLIGSDMERKDNYSQYKITTEKDEIVRFAKKAINYEAHNLIHVFITTYQSASTMIDACGEVGFRFDMGIYDEAHRTTGEKNKQFSKLLNNCDLSKYRLFMTATERIYHENISNRAEDNVYSMNDENVYGGIIYNYSLRMAINNNQLVDYKIVAPYINKSNVLDAIDTNAYIFNLGKIHDIRTILTCYMIIKSMETVRITNMLVFCNKNERAKEMNDIIISLLESKLFKKDTKIDTWFLSGETSMTKRKRVVREFEKSKRAIIFSAKIFGEGIDIKTCDSVCFADNKQSTIDIVQYVGRCLRKCEQKPDKISYVVIPYVMDNENAINILDGDNSDYIKLRRILKVLATTDNNVSSRFSLINHANIFNANVRGIEKNEVIPDDMDANVMRDAIIIKVLDKVGDTMSEARKLLISENEKQYATGNALIIDFITCNKFMEMCGFPALNERPKNIMRYCLGNRLFDEIIKLYYASKDEFIDACDTLGIESVSLYKKLQYNDSKLPPLYYLDNGLYYDIYQDFNLSTLLGRKNKW